MEEKQHVCPWWLGYFLASPIRRLIQKPEKILSPFIDEGMVVADIGSAMGFFTIPAAKLTGNNGKVIAIDLQKRMLSSLEKRTRKAGISDIVETRLCPADSIPLEDMKEKIDFTILFSVVHEVPDSKSLFSQLHSAIKKDGKILFSEPEGHITKDDFEKSINTAEECGFKVEQNLDIKKAISVILVKI